MSNVSPMPPPTERKDKRRLHLREIVQEGQAEISQNGEKEISPAAAKPAISVGAALRAARLARGEETGSIAKALKMRSDQLDAIEDNDFSRLPGRAYVVGFIRSYARYLGLDAGAMIESFKDETAGHESNKPVELVFPEAQEEQRLPNGSILIVALMIAMVIYGISYLTMPNRKSPATAKADDPAVAVVHPAPVASAAPSAVPAPPESSAPAQTVSVLAEPSGATAPAAAPATFVAGNSELPGPLLPVAVMSVNAPSDVFEVASLLPPAASVSARSAALSTIGAPPQTVSKNSNAGSRVTLKALQPTYVRVKDPRQPGGKGILLDRVLNPGESYQAPDLAGLVMQTGNAGGLQVEVDGRSIGVLGKSGEVIVRIPVDASYFLERVAASQ